MPTWHPDGKELAFVIDPWGSPAPPDGLRRLKLGGHEPVMITDGGGWQDANPAWSPDAERIAWTAYEEGRENPKSGVYIISASGTNRRQLTRGGQAPSWSPDGTRIAFFDTYSDAARADSLVEALFVVNADGSGRRRLTHLDDYRR